MDFFSVLALLGGLAIFLYGMNLMGDGLAKVAGGKLERILETLTSNPIRAVLLGMGVTAVIQSSSATTVMVVGFVNSGIMKLSQVVGIIMGANIGTTVTSWILSLTGIQSDNFIIRLFKPTSFSPILALIGVVLIMFTKSQKKKDVGAIFVGFAILMYGMNAMSGAVEPLAEVPEFTGMLVKFSNPILGVVAGAVLTAIIQSSSASVGILQALCLTGMVPFSAALPIIMGQNIGTCVTAILSSVGAKKNAKTAALMHLIFNIIGTIIFSIIAIAYLSIVNPAWAHGNITQTQISMVHTVFNIVTTVLLFPVSDWIIKLAKKIGHVEEEVQDESVVLLDDRMLETPGIAIQSTVSELVRMGHVVADSLEVARKVMFERKEEQIAFLKEEESKVDRLSAGITSYAIKLSTLQINEREHEEVAHMLQIVSDMERISDYCENISEFAESLLEKQVDFSEVGVEHLNKMLDVCIASYLYALEAFESNDRESALKTIEKETEADGLEISLRAKHIKRLTNQQCNTEAGVVFLDSLVCLERISDHARNIAEEVLAE